MYHYIRDKVFLKDMKYLCSNIINQLVQLINNDSLMEVEAHLVGSGAKNLITQNSNEPIDLDYNLMIIDSEININNCREIKEYIRKQFNVILNKNGWNDCMDSTSVLTTEKRHFTKGNHTEFSIDLAIVFNDRNGCHRLIHEKTGFTAWDRYYWNLVPNSRNLFDKVAAIKDEHLWDEVIDELTYRMDELLPLVFLFAHFGQLPAQLQNLLLQLLTLIGIFLRKNTVVILRGLAAELVLIKRFQ